MTLAAPRVRMFAGPNGSGKSTIQSVLRPELLGLYINPDQIEAEIRREKSFDLRRYGIHTDRAESQGFFANSSLLKKSGLLDLHRLPRFLDDRLDFLDVPVNAYIASVVADFLRRKLLEAKVSFSFETVMSSPDKVELLRQAQGIGFRTYLYYVATEDPLINISRICYRVRQGGHDVPQDKIVSRYYRSLDLLTDAIRNSHRAYLFDNSTHEPVWVAEITDGRLLEMKAGQIPTWFKRAVWDKFHAIEE